MRPWSSSLTHSAQIDEQITPEGLLVAVELIAADGNYRLQRGEHELGIVSARILIDVLKRYGRPLEEPPTDTSDILLLADGVSLRTWRYKAPVDLEAKLYLLLYRDGEEPLAVLGRQVANALSFLCGER